MTGILALGGGALGMAPAQSAAAADDRLAAFTGTVANASPTASQYTVFVHVTPETDETFDVGDKVPMLKLPSSSVSVSGSEFTLRIDPETLPAKYVAGDGNVTVEVLADDGKGARG
ncbi:hypothetical protein [Streptomyces sp. CC219B]|uniref:hypothetical protein n=1 Tax=Streptomyces sp. CC219B TaxID=3044574 RepID=UPI0024A8BD33|nr:hypothetical protein [Streptomyces sp. CC219B]